MSHSRVAEQRLPRAGTRFLGMFGHAFELWIEEVYEVSS